LDTDVKRARDRAEAAFKKKEPRDGQQARAEYETARAATREKTARLRALRLARDAAWKRLFRRPKNSRLDRIESE